MLIKFKASISSAWASLADGCVAGVAWAIGRSTTMLGSLKRAGSCVWRLGRMGGSCSRTGGVVVDDVENLLSVALLATSAYPSPP